MHEGELCVTPVGETVPEYLEMKKRLERGRKTNKIFVDMCYFLFFVYHKEDALGNRNLYYSYPIQERKKVIVEKYNLFPGKTKLSDLEQLPEVKAFKEFYIKCNYTEAERTKEAMRAKIDHWRKMYEKMDNSPDEDKEYSDSLQTAQKLFNEYEKKVLLEEKGEKEGMDGCPLYLFEIPESQKPMHIRLKYGDLA